MTPTPPPNPEESIFAHALTLPAAERATYLELACAGDAALRRQVEELLRADDSIGFMATPAAGLAPAACRPDVSAMALATAEENPGDRIGRYKLLQKIGEGGCGTVYMAEQQEPVIRRVALKVIKLGMDTKEVIARFEAERQALALMEHANIARVLDAGATDQGRPFFVMELVRGVPITKYCDEQNLPTAARLELFMQVCHAVQHAHQKGIIHRDLKPSNILVTVNDGQAVPKVIDFGIAKATQGRLTDSTVFTAFEQFIGTPAYMSPEQAVMTSLDVDTRSDIYSLGVLLYELLTGRTPFDSKTLVAAGLDEIRRIIREVDPPRPSTSLATLTDADRTTVAKLRGTAAANLSSLLCGDLDWIVMRCLEKDRTRRYETASSLAQDLQRHLENEPVSARPPSAAYKFGKMARRHRLAFTAATAVAAALVLGAVVSTWHAVRATRAEQIAISERSRAFDERAKAEAAGKREAGLRVEAQANEQSAKTEAAISAAVSNFLQNDLLAQASPDNEPDRDAKLRTVLDRAAQKIEGAFLDQPLVEASIRTTLAMTFQSLGEYSQMQRHLERALQLRQQRSGPGDPETLNLAGKLVNAFTLAGRFEDAATLGAKTLAQLQLSSGPEHPAALTAMVSLAKVYWAAGRRVEAEALHAKTLEIRKRILGPDHPDTLASTAYLAFVYARNQGKLVEAAALCAQALDILQRVRRPEPSDTLNSMATLAAAFEALGRGSEAIALHARALDIRIRTLGPEHPDTLSSMGKVAFVYTSQDRIPEAISLHAQALDIKRRVLGPDHPSTLISMGWLATAYAAQGSLDKAATLHAQAFESWNHAFGSEHPNTLAAAERLCRVFLQQQKFSEAEPILRRTLESRSKSAPNPWQTAEVTSLLGEALTGLMRYSEAEPLLLASYESLSKQSAIIPSPNKASIRATVTRLVRLYTTSEHPEKAVEWQEKLAEFNATEKPAVSLKP